VLAALTFERAALAGQLRFELRDKLCALRAAYAERQGDARALHELAAAAAGSLFHLLRGLLRLVPVKADVNAVAAMGDMARHLGLELRTLQALHRLRQGETRLNLAGLTALFGEVFLLLDRAARKADALAAPPPKPKAKPKAKPTPPPPAVEETAQATPTAEAVPETPATSQGATGGLSAIEPPTGTGGQTASGTPEEAAPQVPTPEPVPALEQTPPAEEAS
jgi:hypothetical protein